MTYLGGKARCAEEIARIINAQPHDPRAAFVSPFCGSGAVESLVKGFNKKRLSNFNRYTVAMLKEAAAGRIYPDEVPESEYERLKSEVRSGMCGDVALAGFVGFGCTFGGAFYAGYARDPSGRRKYAAAASRSMKKTGELLRGAEIFRSDYRTARIGYWDVVYCDPPYKGTSGFRCTPPFDSEAFWTWARITSLSNLVFISETEAPEDFACVWEKEIRAHAFSGDRNKMRTEKLFIYKKRLDKFMEP